MEAAGVEAAGVLVLAAGAAAGAGAGAAGVEAGAEAGAVDAVEESAAVAFLDFVDFFGVEASVVEVEAAGVSDLVVDFFEVPESAVEASAVSAFLDLEDFLAVDESVAAVLLSVVSDFFDFEDFLAVEESAAAVLLSAVSDFLDFEVDFLAPVEESAVADEDFLVEDVSAEVSSVVFFFFLDLVVELVSD